MGSIDQKNRMIRFIERVVEQLKQLVLQMEKKEPNDNKYVRSKEDYSKNLDIFHGFIRILEQFQIETSLKRKIFIKNLKSYLNVLRQDKRYLNTSFMWFLYSLFDRAIPYLIPPQLGSFEFYSYLYKPLVRMHELLIQGTKLDDFKWEKEQIRLFKSGKPLQQEDINLLEDTYALITSENLGSLDSKIIKKYLFKTHPNYRRKLVTNYLSWDCHWDLIMNPPAFGLERIFFLITLQKDTHLNEIINFKDINNSTLCGSHVYRSRDNPKLFLGTLLIPSLEEEKLMDYFRSLETNSKIKINLLKKIIRIHFSYSLSLYKSGEGWRCLTMGEKRRLIEKLTKKSRKRRKETEKFYLSQYGSNYLYLESNNPLEDIKFISNVPVSFTFDNLPLNTFLKAQGSFNQEREKKNLTTLKKLLQQKALTTGFRSDYLWYAWAVEAYWVIIPREKKNEIDELLQWLPLIELFYTPDEILGRVRLPIEFVKILEEDLNWEVIRTIRHHDPIPLCMDYFDVNELKWKKPQIMIEWEKSLRMK